MVIWAKFLAVSVLSLTAIFLLSCIYNAYINFQGGKIAALDFFMSFPIGKGMGQQP